MRLFYQDFEFIKRPAFNNDLGDHPTFFFYIYDDGLNIPIFHVVPHQDYKDIGVCLFEPRYYQYTANKDLQYSSFDIVALNNVLKEPNERNPEKTNWEILVHDWIYCHIIDSKTMSKEKFKKKYPDIINQPDYTKLDDNPIMKRGFIRAFIAKWNA